MIRAWRNSSAGLIESSAAEPQLSGDGVCIAVEAAVVGAVDLRSSGELTACGAAVGTVVDTGEGALHLQGRRVAAGPIMPCGECDVCRRGAAVVCPQRQVLGQSVAGVLAERALLRARWVCPLDAELELPGPAAALIGRELADAYAMFAMTGIAPGEPVIVIGDDVRARLLAQVAVAKGVAPLFLSSLAPAWVEDAGAVLVAVEAEADHSSIRAALKDAASKAGHGTRPWRLLETGGTATSRALAAAMAGPGSTLTFGPTSGESSSDTELSGFDLTRLGCRVIGVPAAHPDLIPEAAALVVRGDIDLAALVRVIDTGDLGRAADLIAESPHDALVVQVNPS